MNRTLLCALAAVTVLLLTNCSSPEQAGNLHETHFVSLGTNRIYYLAQGRGPHTVVLVHCWAGNSGFWQEQLPALVGRARLILIDLPGHGQSDKPHRDYTMDYFAQAVLAVLRDANVHRATLIGHSMGVPVICRVYAQAPEKVAALVAVDGTLRRPQMSAEQAENFVQPFRARDYRGHVTKFLGTMFPAPGTEALRDRVESEILATPQYVMVGAMEGMFNPGQPDWDLKKVNVPVLVLNAKNPLWTPEYEAYARALSAQTDYRVIEG